MTSLLTLLTAALLACGGGDAGPKAPAAPGEIGLEECAVCGMVVREQPAPRAQVLHRDGERAFLCSIGDLRAHLSAPSSHGKATATWVEVVPPDLAPADLGVAPRPWVAADQASYVVGFERGGVMGLPVLAYTSPAEAEAAAPRLGGRTTTWAALQAVSFDQVPGHEGH